MDNNISQTSFEITKLCMQNKDLSKLSDTQIAELFVTTLYSVEGHVRNISRNKIIP